MWRASCARWPRFPKESGRLPDPSYVWWKAQLLRQWEANRRATAPLETANPIEIVAAVVGLVVLLLWEGPDVLAWLAGSDRSALTRVAAPIAARYIGDAFGLNRRSTAE